MSAFEADRFNRSRTSPQQGTSTSWFLSSSQEELAANYQLLITATFCFGKMSAATPRIFPPALLLGPPFYDSVAGRCRSEEHTSELQSRVDLVCRLLLEKKKTKERQKEE